MTERRTFRWTLAITLAACGWVTACVVVPAQPGYGGGAVMVAPPAPQYEVVGVAPGPGFFWIGGYWGWGGGRHVWTPGHWEANRPGYRWAPHQWRRDGSAWRESSGHWERH